MTEGHREAGIAQSHLLGRGSAQAQVQLEVVDHGVLNAIVFWFDLHLDEHESITNSPCHEKAHYYVGASNSSVFGSQADGGLQSGLHQRRGGCRGQALQYLDAALPVQPGPHSLGVIDRVSSIQGASCTGVWIPIHVENSSLSGLRFSLPEDIGAPVPKAPWLVSPKLNRQGIFCSAADVVFLSMQVEWGGGASVENPHRQRVLYCELLIKDLLQRLPSGRFPSVEEDMKVGEMVGAR